MFLMIKNEHARINVGEPSWVPAAAGSYEYGQALVLTGGKVSKAEGDVTVMHVCAEKKTITADGDRLACVPVTDSQVYAVPLAAAVTPVVGNAYQIGTGGLTVGATSVSNGTGAVVVDANGAKAAGDIIHVKLKSVISFTSGSNNQPGQNNQ